MKNHLLSAALLTGLQLTAHAGSPTAVMASPNTNAFADAISPISNPTLAGLALPRTNIHAMAMHQQHPDTLTVANGVAAPVGGDLNVFAVQLEYTFNERLSLIATKDGYIDFNPDNTLSKQEGFANLAAGLKYAFIYDEANQFVASGSAVIEVPTGNSDVFQGHGDGAANLILSTLKLKGDWQLSTATGVQLPFDTDAQATTAFTSLHASYKLTEKFSPIAEVNWFRVLSAGERTAAGTGANLDTAALTDFEGGDLLNLGGGNATANKDIVTAALGARYQLNDSVSLGAAYEIPLTDEEDNLMKSRVTLDAVLTF